jgi:hypothetical protein
MMFLHGEIPAPGTLAAIVLTEGIKSREYQSGNKSESE